MKKIKRAFTLVELVVVIAIIAVLTSVTVGTYFAITVSANNSRCEQEIMDIYNHVKTKVIADNYINSELVNYTKEGFELKYYDVEIMHTLLEEVYPQESINITISTESISSEHLTKNEYNNLFMYGIQKNNKVLLRYLGYISKNLDYGYAKYIDCLSGEFIHNVPDDEYLNTENDIGVSELIVQKNSINDNPNIISYTDNENMLSYGIIYRSFSPSSKYFHNIDGIGRIKRIEIVVPDGVDPHNDVKIYMSKFKIDDVKLYAEGIEGFTDLILMEKFNVNEKTITLINNTNTMYFLLKIDSDALLNNKRFIEKFDVKFKVNEYKLINLNDDNYNVIFSKSDYAYAYPTVNYINSNNRHIDGCDYLFIIYSKNDLYTITTANLIVSDPGVLIHITIKVRILSSSTFSLIILNNNQDCGYIFLENCVLEITTNKTKIVLENFSISNSIGV